MRTSRSEQRGRPMPDQYRQGDVLLCRVSKVHSGFPVPPDAGGRLVIAEGEHSGHAHALAPERAQLFRRGRQLLLSVGAAAPRYRTRSIHRSCCRKGIT